MSWLGDVEHVAGNVGKRLLNATEGIPIAGSAVALPAAGIQALAGDTKGAGQSLINAIPGYGSLNAYSNAIMGNQKGLQGNWPKSGGGTSSPSSTDMSEFETALKGVDEAGISNPSADLLTKLSGFLGQMTPSQAQSVLNSIKGDTTLSSELQGVLSGETPAQVYQAHMQQVNPSTSGTQAWTDIMGQVLGNVYKDTMLPAAQKLNAGSTAQYGSDIGAMEQALKGASPQEQQAMAGIPQEMKANEDQLVSAQNLASASAPAYNNLVQTLGNAVNQYKLAQQAYALAPYYTQMIQSGQTPQGIAGTSAAGGLLAPPAIP